MRFLGKNKNSEILKKKLKYSEYRDRKLLRNILLYEQYGFCAYTEKYIYGNYDFISIEHFYPQKQFPEKIDDYYNLYAVGIINQNKPKKIILPILQPSSKDITKRIKYKNGYFIPNDKEDIEAQNFIDFLNIGKNNIDLTLARRRHVNRIKRFLTEKNYQTEDLKYDKRNFDYITALIEELPEHKIEKTFIDLIKNN